jgi:hypothetical protein
LLTQTPLGSLLQPNLGTDALVPADEALTELSALVQGTDDPLAWTEALDALLSAPEQAPLRVERLEALQMLAGVGGTIGARLLAAFWTLPDLDSLAAVMAADPALAPLAALTASREGGALDLPELAGGTLRLVSLADQLCQAGCRETGFDLITAAAIVQANHGNGEAALAVERDVAVVVARVLASPRPFRDGFAGTIDGVSLVPGLVLIDLQGAAGYLPHGFPVLVGEGRAALGGHLPSTDGILTDADEEAAARAQAVDRLRLRKLVLDNIMSTSVLLEFLRDPKVSSIPGLVADVVDRTRNPQVLEVIIANRTLHTGFANKAVPLACLRSPVNVSLKSLRRFIHVKYVSKVDLKRLANDRTGIRREVGQEIEKYLQSLA